MKSLCLNVEVLNSEGQEIDLRGSEEDTRSGLGIDIGRRPGADNAMAD